MVRWKDQLFIRFELNIFEIEVNVIFQEKFMLRNMFPFKYWWFLTFGDLLLKPCLSNILHFIIFKNKTIFSSEKKNENYKFVGNTCANKFNFKQNLGHWSFFKEKTPIFF